MIRMRDIIRMDDSGGPGKKEESLLKENQEKDISSVVEEMKANKLEAAELYNRGITLMGDVLNRTRKDEEIGYDPILDFIKSLVDAMLIEESEQLAYFYGIASAKDYLSNHSVNVSLLSIKIGVWTGLNMSELIELAVASLLHDLGMVKVEDIVKKESRLGAWERRKVKRHPEYGEQILRKMDCLNEEVISAVKTHHHRGPRNKFSQVIGLADIYEAITHARVYKKAKPPDQAVKEIITKEVLSFQSDIIKAFVNNIGIYPVGSWVRLSTGEVGMVIGENKGYPLRPRVKIMFNHLGEQLKDMKILDFMSESYFYIDGPFDVADKERLKKK